MADVSLSPAIIGNATLFEIYRVTHRASGKVYIGCTKNGVAERWKGHVRTKGKRRTVLHHAIAKYGQDAFIVEVVELATSVESMLLLERKWIEECNSIAPNGYNMTSGGDGAFDPCPETIIKLRAISLGNKHFLGRTHSAETKAKMSASAVRSPEHRAAISRAQKGRIVSAETGAKISAANKGVKRNYRMSDEAKAKLSKMRRDWWANNRYRIAEISRNMSASRKGKPSPILGKPKSAEHRANMAAARTGKHLTEATKAKIRAAWARRKAASAAITKIPLPLASYIAEVFNSLETA